MKFNLGASIVLPFTVQIPGKHQADLDKAVLSAYIYNSRETAISTVLSSITVSDISDTNTGSTVYAELRVSGENNDLEAGNYFAVIILELEDITKELIRLPFVVSDTASPFNVIFANKQYLTTAEQMTMLRSILPPGIQKGMNVSLNTAFTGALDVASGVLSTDEGYFIQFLGKQAAVTIEQLENSNKTRMDIVAVKFDDPYSEPTMVVLKGEESFTAPIPPSVPAGHTSIAFVEIPKGNNMANMVITSAYKRYMGVPVNNVSPLTDPDGVRTDFTFPVSLNPETIIVKVDGIPQVYGQDYTLFTSENYQTGVRFIGETVQQGQWLCISGEAYHRTAYNYGWVYTEPEAEDQETWINGLVESNIASRYWSPANYLNGKIVSTASENEFLNFSVSDPSMQNYNPVDGYFLEMGYRVRAATSNIALSVPVTIATQVKTIYSTMASGDWLNLFTFGMFSVILVYSSGGSIIKLRYSPSPVDKQDVNIIVSDISELKIAVKLTAGTMTLWVNGQESSRNISDDIVLNAPVILGDVLSYGKGLPVKFMGMAIFPSVLSSTDLAH